MLAAIDLAADMSAREVLARLALNGYWISASDPAARRRIEDVARRLRLPAEDVAFKLRRDARNHGVAIRRQWHDAVLWYAYDLNEVLARCSQAAPDDVLAVVLDLREQDSVPVVELGEDGATALRTGVVTDHGKPVAVVLATALEALGEAARGYRGVALPAASASAVLAPAPQPTQVPSGTTQAWPRVDVPEFARAEQPFDVVVGFSIAQDVAVAGGPIDLPFTDEAPSLELSVELTASAGLEALEGWTRPLRVSRQDIATAQVRFRLVGRAPQTAATSRLASLEVRYLLGGTICGTASRPVVILPTQGAAAPVPSQYGMAWQRAAPAASTPVRIDVDPNAPDLTVEISKPDRNAASGQYVCKLYSPHPLEVGRGPFHIDIGQDAKTFARALVDEVRLLGTSELLGDLLESVGRLVADRLPPAVLAALRETAAIVAPAVPALLIVSAEPFVPWELAWMELPLDSARPRHLGAQALVGRWLRDDVAGSAARPALEEVARPALSPISCLAVRNMALMAPWYESPSGLRRLPKAEEEVQVLARDHAGVLLQATQKALGQLLNAKLADANGGIEIDAVHFAGHGDFDSSRPDGSALFLQDGLPLRSMLFRAAKYGGDKQPLMFLNACMLGIGGELLGDMAGFPGNSLRGGFGGVVGALWEVDDVVAHDLALEFWRRVLPPPPATGEPVGSVLRDLRSKAHSAAGGLPTPTYLAYVYYGHPRLTLRRSATA